MPKHRSTGQLLDNSLERAIVEEMFKAAERLGADPTEIRAVPATEMYDTLEALGADRFLLAIVGSWRDCLGDEQVLDMLRSWNRHGSMEFDALFASTSRPARPGRRRHLRRVK